MSDTFTWLVVKQWACLLSLTGYVPFGSITVSL